MVTLDGQTDGMAHDAPSRLGVTERAPKRRRTSCQNLSLQPVDIRTSSGLLTIVQRGRHRSVSVARREGRQLNVEGPRERVKVEDLPGGTRGEAFIRALLASLQLTMVERDLARAELGKATAERDELAAALAVARAVLDGAPVGVGQCPPARTI